MRVALRNLLGLGRIPSHRTSASRWFERKGIRPKTALGNGGSTHYIEIADLPAKERDAYLHREIERSGLAPGESDDAAHTEFLGKPASVQEEAWRRDAYVRFLTVRRNAGMRWRDAVAEARAAFEDCPSSRTLSRHCKDVSGIDPINWAPALAPGHKGSQVQSEISPEAWNAFEAEIDGAWHTLPLVAAWRKVNKQAKEQGWAWPPVGTVRRRWKKLSATRRRTLQHGKENAAKSLVQHQHRTTDGMGALEQVEMDGRPLDIWADFGDGKPVRPHLLIAVDRASSKVLGHVIAQSENSEAVKELFLQVCERHSIPDRVLTDNGAAFTSRRIAGGTSPRYRTRQQRSPSWALPGVAKILGIKLDCTKPGTPQAKLPESTFSALRHIDDSAEFEGAHAGHDPLDKPSTNTVPVSIDVVRAVYAEGIRDYNEREGSRAEQAHGGSPDDAFARLSEGRRLHSVSPLQRRRVRLQYFQRTVMRDGRVRFANGLFGDASTQNAMLRHEGRKLLIGIDPTDFHAPAMVFEPSAAGDGWKLFLEELPPYEKTPIRSEEGRRRAQREIRRVREAVAAEAFTGGDTRRQERQQAALAASPAEEPQAPAKVVAPTFDNPIRDGKPTPEPEELSQETVDFRRRLRANIPSRTASGE